MKDDPWDLEHLDISDYSKEELESYIRRLETENAEINEKLDSKRKTIKSLCEELDSLRIVSIEIERLRIENKHLQESRPQSELDAAHLAAENAMLNANFARYISATQDTEKQNERLASMVRELQDENAALLKEIAPLRETVGVRGDAVTSRDDIDYWSKLVDRADKAVRLETENAALRSLVQHWYKLVPENIRSSIEDAQKEAKP